MCGRFTLTQPAEIAARFELDNFAPVEPEFYTPRFNVAPTQRIVVIPTSDGQRVARRMRWGLIPSWAKDVKIGSSMINARAEGVLTKPSFRNAFRSRRCLIPADGFYEWRPTPSGKQPYRITLADGSMFAFAGLWERWRDPATDEWIESCCIVTCEPNELTEKFHDRMPVILGDADYDAWLTGTPERALKLLKPNQHPGYASVKAGDDHIAGVVAQLQASPQWNNMVIIVTYDENGGAWDHVAPPKGDLLGPGSRIPAIIISPLAKKRFVDHTQYDTASTIRLITRRFGLPVLPGIAARDSALTAAGGQAMGDLTNALNL